MYGWWRSVTSRALHLPSPKWGIMGYDAGKSHTKHPGLWNGNLPFWIMAQEQLVAGHKAPQDVSLYPLLSALLPSVHSG